MNKNRSKMHKNLKKSKKLSDSRRQYRYSANFSSIFGALSTQLSDLNQKDLLEVSIVYSL